MLHRLLFENPAPLFTVIFLLAFTVLRRFRKEHTTQVRNLGLSFGIVAVLAYLCVLVMNATRGGLLWHDEANILSIAASWRNGQPMYQAANSAQFTTLFYGPATYLAYAPFLHATPHSLLLLRILVSFADLASIALLFGVLRAWLPAGESFALLSIAIVVLLCYPDELLGIRGDPLLVLLSSLALFLAIRTPPRWAIAAMVLAGIAIGLAIDLKATVVPIMCVVVAIAFYRLGRTSALAAASAASVVALGIFALHGISLPNYIHSLQLASHQPLLRSTCLLNLFVVFVLLLPSLHLRWRRIARAGRRRGEFNVLLLTLLAIGVCVGTGSKFSAGPWHLWPLIPFLLAAGAYELSTASSGERRTDEAHLTEAARTLNPETTIAILQRKTAQIAALAIAGGVAALFFCAQDVHLLRPLDSRAFRTSEFADVVELQQDVAADHARTLVMGSGSNLDDERTNLRYELPLAGERYIFDENEVVEARKESLGVPSATIAQIRACAEDWLIPHGDAPFSAIRSGLVPGDSSAPMFPDDLRAAFLANYSLLRQGTAYDLWGCRDRSTVVKASLY